MASEYAIPTDKTQGMAPNNFYYAYQRAEAVSDPNNGWTLKLYYNSIQFFFNISDAPGGKAGEFTYGFPGYVTLPEGSTWESKDYADGDDASAGASNLAQNPASQAISFTHRGYFAVART